jgi:hypothetical protein
MSTLATPFARPLYMMVKPVGLYVIWLANIAITLKKGTFIRKRKTV